MKHYKTKIRLKVFSKRIALMIFACLGYLIGLVLWQKLFSKNKRLRILRYHSISDYKGHEINVKIKDFKQQMEFLHKYYKPVSLREGLNYLKKNVSFYEKAVVVTFDDGYKDNFTNAYPVLRQLQIPATIFLTAGYVGTGKILSHDLRDNPLYSHLLSWDEAREMLKGGIDFGSHTLSHANLGKENIDLNQELKRSKKIIEEGINKEVWAISYPFGRLKDFNRRVKQITREAGYICGCSAMNGANDADTDIFELKRIGIEAPDNMFTFRAKLNGTLDLLVIKDKPIFNKLLVIFNRLIGV